jgi:sugar phosphate isomerase/epimerase
MTQFSYQLYSSRNFGPLSKTLEMLAKAGYAQVEGWGGLYANLDQLDALKADLAKNNLKMTSGHVGFDQVQGEPKRVIEIAKALGLQAVFVPAPPTPDYREGKGDWAELAKALGEAGKPYWDAGLDFGYHNHHWEFTPQNGAVPLDLILGADPRMQLEFDVAWGIKAGQDPLATIAKYKDQLVAAHVKDLAPAGENADEDGWADVGTGVMDWTGIMAALKGAGVKLFVMEHDNPKDDARFAKRSIENANKL